CSNGRFFARFAAFAVVFDRRLIRSHAIRAAAMPSSGRPMLHQVQATAAAESANIHQPSAPTPSGQAQARRSPRAQPAARTTPSPAASRGAAALGTWGRGAAAGRLGAPQSDNDALESLSRRQ